MRSRHPRGTTRRPGRTPALLLTLAMSLAFGALLWAGQAKVKPKDLPSQYQEWLKLVDYIIMDRERDVFLHLTTDRDRDLFIQAFWRLRDPTPGTPENEFQTEHLKRFQEANHRFKFGSAREGWMTDRGRFYIILGPPVSTEQIAGSSDVYPAEIWSYYGNTDKGMPVHFELVFYQYHNAGEYKLYDPFSDGPARLLVKGMTDYTPSDYESMYKQLFKVEPDLAIVAFSIIPGEMSAGYQPSLQSLNYMAAIMDSPKKGLDESYATHFLNFKGVVSTEYLTNYIKNVGQVAIVFDPLTDLAFCDFAVVPEHLSLDYYDPKSEYFCAFQIDVSLKSGDTTVFQYGKEYPLTIPEDRFKDTEGMGLAVADSFPIIEGKYHLTVLMRNTAGKEFTVFEHDVEVPPADGPPRIVGPVVGVKLAEAPAGARLPFQAERKKLNPDPKNPFAASDEIVYQFSVIGHADEVLRGGRVEVLIKGKTGDHPFQRSFTIPLDTGGPRRAQSFTNSMPAADLPPDYYDLTLVLKDSRGNDLDQQKANFIVSPAKSLAHPQIAAKSFSLANIFMFYYMLAHQYDQMDRMAEAEAAYKKAYAMNPSYLQKIPDYAAFLLKDRKPADALTVIEAAKSDAKLQFSYYLLRGRALLDLKRYDEAVQSLSLGNKMYNSDAGLLAALGSAYHGLGKKEDALEALRASLRLNPNQPEVERLIREIEGKK
ncbi:MAG: GWxTD domain-containing protein [Candidatus Aminicenantales bacterium]